MLFNGEGAFDSLHIFLMIIFCYNKDYMHVHIVVGMGLIAWIIYRVMKGNVNQHYFTPVEMVGLYWHFVDVVWIFLFPLLYLL